MQYYLAKDITWYLNANIDSCYKLSPNIIQYYDFTFVLDGTMIYYADNVKIELHKNDALFLKPGTLRSRASGTTPVHYISFNFYTPDYMDAEFPFSPYMPQCITETIRKMVSMYPPTKLNDLFYSKEKCILLLNQILYELLTTSISKCKNEHVMKLLYYIEEHITEPLTLTRLSAYVNLSKEYTSYIFRKETGKTLTAYVNERKLLFAKELIANEKMSLKDTAAYLGYENYNYFSTLFKRYMATTPVALKQNNRSGKPNLDDSIRR